ncbi:hypothetical protein JCM10212_004883 [Sporobolomyces blumeae]
MPTARTPWLAALVWLATCLQTVVAYQALVAGQDAVRQVCSGVWASSELGKGSQDASIEILFAPASRGQVALVVFEWEDAKDLGVDATGAGKENEWQSDRAYICTLAAQQAGLCQTSDLGKFIVSGSPADNSSIWTTSVRFDAVPSAPLSPDEVSLGTGPYRYEISKSGYYCVSTVPVALQDARYNSTYAGVVDFESVYGGHLPGAEYPKILFFKYLTIAYLFFTLAWCALCYINRRDLLSIQNYVAGLSFVLLFDHFLSWRYQAYLNNAGHPGVAGAYLVLVSVSTAARNSLSLYLLCVASMGLSIMRPTLGSVLGRVRLLAICHLVFGVLYALGTVAIPVESTGFFVLFFVIPLALTLVAFMTWILYSLSSTISDLTARRQSYKRTMFVRLKWILVIAISTVLVFFVASAVTFSSRHAPSFPARTWRTRWLVVDGWSSILYLVVFFAIAALWVPTRNNRRLSLSDEVAQTEDEADLYDVDRLLPDDEREDAEDVKDSFAMGSVSRRSSSGGRDEDREVVFEVGSDDDEETHLNGTRRKNGSGSRARGGRASDGGGSRRWSEAEDRNLDITTQHGEGGGYDAPPPEYRSSKHD